MTLSVVLRHHLPGMKLDMAFEAPAGVTSLFGPSGAGKTTVVNTVAGLLRPDFAQIRLGGETLADTGAGVWLAPHKRRLGYVFQEGRLFPHLDVRANLDYSARVTGRRIDKATFADIVDMLGIGPLLNRRPEALSGGEKQRVALGRALLAAPRLLLLDEPMAALDEARKDEILPYLERIRDAAEVPILHVSHSAQEVARLATSVVVIEAGHVVRAGPAAEVLSDPSLSPSGPRALGAVLVGRVRARHADGLVEIDSGGARLFVSGPASPPGTRLRLRIAAEDVILSRSAPQGLSALNILGGTIVEIRENAGGAVVALETDAGRLLARLTRRSVARLGLQPGVQCYAIVKTVSFSPADIGFEDPAAI